MATAEACAVVCFAAAGVVAAATLRWVWRGGGDGSGAGKRRSGHGDASAEVSGNATGEGGGNANAKVEALDGRVLLVTALLCVALLVLGLSAWERTAQALDAGAGADAYGTEGATAGASVWVPLSTGTTDRIE